MTWTIFKLPFFLFAFSRPLCYWYFSTYLVKCSKFEELAMRCFSTHDSLFLLEVKWTESSFWSRSVTHSFVRKAPWQLKEIGRSLFYTFPLQGSDDFDCEQKQSHLFQTAFQTMTVCRKILFASYARVAYLFCHC